MAAAQYDIEIEQGATHSESFTWEDGNGTPVNLTGYKARMQFRKSATSTEKLLDASTENGLIVLTPLEGAVSITLPASLTSAFSWAQARYDLELESSDGTVVRLVEGAVTVSKEITRD